jgi:DNA-binding MarR family transcriptional regulator
VTTLEPAPPATARSADPVEWARHFWRRQSLGQGEEAFVTMSSVMRFHRLLTAAIEAELKRHELQLTDYMVLMILEMSPSGTRSVSRLARALLVHATTAKLATERLDARGLVSRTPDPNDRRATLVALTEPGRSLVLAATSALQLRDFGFVGTTETDRHELIDLLTRLGPERRGRSGRH